MLGGSAIDISSSSRGSPATPTQENRENHDKNANSAARPIHQRRLSFKRNSTWSTDAFTAEEPKRETLPRVCLQHTLMGKERASAILCYKYEGGGDHV